MYDKRQFQDLKPGEIAGMGTINPVMRFLRNIRSTQSHVHIDGNPCGGIDIAVDVPESGSSTSFHHAFQPAISGSTLTIGEGLAYVGTITFDSGSTYQSIAPSTVQASTWTIDSAQQKYFSHYHIVTTFVTQQSGGYTATEVSTFAIERASVWPVSYNTFQTDTASGWISTVDERWPLFEIVGVSESYQAIVHNFGLAFTGG